eukprot:GHVL01012564.1.p1 GENE.GHVL01012564.1~~GHVL01012564.1.p1  ORF type:complete len:431 (+),score=94.71 GHVL01012564.1:73-1365(+)
MKIFLVFLFFGHVLSRKSKTVPYHEHRRSSVDGVGPYLDVEYNIEEKEYERNMNYGHIAYELSIDSTYLKFFKKELDNSSLDNNKKIYLQSREWSKLNKTPESYRKVDSLKEAAKQIDKSLEGERVFAVKDLYSEFVEWGKNRGVNVIKDAKAAEEITENIEELNRTSPHTEWLYWIEMRDLLQNYIEKWKPTAITAYRKKLKNAWEEFAELVEIEEIRKIIPELLTVNEEYKEAQFAINVAQLLMQMEDATDENDKEKKREKLFRLWKSKPKSVSKYYSQLNKADTLSHFFITERFHQSDETDFQEALERFHQSDETDFQEALQEALERFHQSDDTALRMALQMAHERFHQSDDTALRKALERFHQLYAEGIETRALIDWEYLDDFLKADVEPSEIIDKLILNLKKVSFWFGTQKKKPIYPLIYILGIG